ncbi:histidine--tRNA ligase [Candidatus Microgenomates bacterium]|nr:histidine--tRNA ligase [Candidatus Microgenomates bacterium]
MKKIIKPQTLKGFRDFLPEEAIKRQYLKDKIKQVFELYGYDPIETPALEYLETFAGQIGEDEKLFYKFQDQGRRWVALRYDQSVPAARFVAQYPDKISLPFKRYQIQPVWRAEKPQKGRYREFIHSDADIFGVPGPEADAEVIALSMDIYKSLGFKEIRTLINDRSMYKDIPYPVIVCIDKLKKIGQEAVIQEIAKKGYSQTQAEEYLKKVVSLKPNQTIKTIFDYLKTAGFSNSWYKFEPALARSFSYSTGPIWEIEIPGFEAGSVLGGERFDKLIGTFQKIDVAATGFGLGFDRTLEAMKQFNLIPNPRTKTQVLVTIFSPELLKESIKLASKLRTVGINTDLYSNPSTKLDKQLKYADKKGIAYAIILGPEEIKKNIITLKNLQNRTQQTDSLDNIIKKLKKR